MGIVYAHIITLCIISLCIVSCTKAREAEKLFLQCLSHYEKHELEKAASCFEQARAHNDVKTRSILMLARVHYFENKFADARALLEDIIDDEPSHTGARYWLARALALDPAEKASDERDKKAIEHLKKALEIDPHHIRARSLLALLYEKHNMHREALYEYLAALEEEETLVSARANLSILYRRLGLAERARTELERAIAISKAASISSKSIIAIKDQLSEQ